MDVNREEVKRVRARLLVNKEGVPYSVSTNYMRVLYNDSLLVGAIRRNMLTDRMDIVRPLGWAREGSSLTDTDLKYLQHYFESNYLLGSEKKLENALAIIANENRYHPIRDYLNNLKWDGQERIRYCLHHFLGAEVSQYTYEAFRLYLLGALSRVFKPGCKFDLMLCLVGGQGAGKSSLFRLLAIKDEWYTDDLKRVDDENVFRKMQGHWIIEFPEMSAMVNAKSIEELKAFITRQRETYKVPYDKFPADRDRQCVFGGTSNNLDFLPMDRTGNRRFIPIQAVTENAEVHILEDEDASRKYIDQLWAEAMHIYHTEEVRLRFTPEMDRYLMELQQGFMPEDTDAGQIIDYLENFKGTAVCSLQLYKEALGHTYETPKKWELRAINDIINNSVSGWIPYKNPRRYEDYGRQRGWERVSTPPPSEVGNETDNEEDGFRCYTDEQFEQMGLPFTDDS